MTPKDALSLEQASTYLAMDPQALAALAVDRRIPSLEIDGHWLFSKKSIDKWRLQWARRS